MNDLTRRLKIPAFFARCVTHQDATGGVVQEPTDGFVLIVRRHSFDMKRDVLTPAHFREMIADLRCCAREAGEDHDLLRFGMARGPDALKDRLIADVGTPPRKSRTRLAKQTLLLCSSFAPRDVGDASIDEVHECGTTRQASLDAAGVTGRRRCA